MKSDRIRCSGHFSFEDMIWPILGVLAVVFVVLSGLYVGLFYALKYFFEVTFFRYFATSVVILLSCLLLIWAMKKLNIIR